jgi:amidohydrolase
LSDWAHNVDAWIDTNREELIAIRRHLHAHPEPSGEETATTEYLVQRLEQAGLLVTPGPNGRGLWAEPAAQTGDKVALRADIDALRLSDDKAVGYRSLTVGVAHACGHDTHAAMAVGAALALLNAAHVLPAALRWRLILQPAEETSVGARELIDAGVMKDVKAIVGLHVDPDRDLERVGFSRGTLTAFCDEIDIVVSGSGGHAARPHAAADPIAAAVQLISAIYQLLPRSIDPREAAVATFGYLHGGNARNVIPSRVEIKGTMRTHSRESRDTLESRILATADGIGRAPGTTVEVAFHQGPDAVVNDERATELCEQAAAGLLGPEAIEPIGLASLGGEDFAEYLLDAPGCFFRLGTRGGPESAFPLHSGWFDIDERAVALGAKLFARCVVALGAIDTPR